VDEAGAPVHDSRIAVHPPNGRKIEAAAPTGEFTIKVPLIGNEMLLSAQNQSGELQGLTYFRARQEGPIRVTLRKAREMVVTVADPTSRPIAGARIGLDAGNAFLRQGTIAEQLTDDAGRAVLRYPAEAALQSIFAVKRDVGINFNPLSVGPSEAQTIVLGDNVTVQVRVTDDEDKPLAGVAIQPLSISKGRSFFQVREFIELEVKTDEGGLATVRTLPKDISNRVLFDVRMDGYTAIGSVTYDPRTAPQEISVSLAPAVPLRGRVSAGDGNLPGHVDVIAAGVSHRTRESSGPIVPGWHAGPEAISFRTVCDQNGAFELPVAKNHYYALVASSPRIVAETDRIVSPIQTLIVRGDPPTERLTLTLGSGTRVYGTAPLAGNGRMRLLWRDAESYSKLPADQRLPNRTGDSSPLVLSLALDALIVSQGQFQFYVPPGKYTLSAAISGGNPIPIEVTDQKELRVDYRSSGLPPGAGGGIANRPQQPQPELIDLAGRVVLESDRDHGVANIMVRRSDIGTQFRGPGGAGFNTIVRTGSDGSFKMTRPASESLLLASTTDGLLSSIVEIPATATEVDILLAPTAAFRGRLTDRQTMKPLAGRQIETTMIRTDQQRVTSLSASAITDARGEFVLTGLTPGWPVELELVMTPRGLMFAGPGAPPGGFRGRTTRRMKSEVAQKPELYDLGDVSTSDSAAPPLDQLIADATRNTTIQGGRLEAALAQADLLDQHLLVFAAAATSEIFQQFFKLWHDLEEQSPNGALTDLATQHILLALDTSQNFQPFRGRPDRQTILQQAGIDPPVADDAGLAILQADGKVLATTTGRNLLTDGKLDAEKLTAFLQKHTPEPPDAEKLLADALAKAKRTGKRVLVFRTVPLSAPSALLNLFLQAQKDVLAKDFVCVTLSPRYVGTPAAVQSASGELRPIPWLAVLDESGKSLASTIKPADPDPPGGARVAELLQATARTLTSDEIQAVVKALWVP
jgi:hypothetical protein